MILEIILAVVLGFSVVTMAVYLGTKFALQSFFGHSHVDLEQLNEDN